MTYKNLYYLSAIKESAHIPITPADEPAADFLL